jgi:hypothetical protein
MKLKIVLASVNNNRDYYLFIPIQIYFWKKLGVKFIAIFCGNKLPDELINFKENIILWTKNAHVNSSFVGQNIRIYYPALIPDVSNDELVMITDMDMLPGNISYYDVNINNFNKDDFIYYRNIDGNEIYMCYNAAHPHTWSKIFDIKSESDIENAINQSYNLTYDGTPGCLGWNIDQQIMYNKLIDYSHLKILNKKINRLEVNMYRHLLNINYNDGLFIHLYDDIHLHRSFTNNRDLIDNCVTQFTKIFNK